MLLQALATIKWIPADMDGTIERSNGYRRMREHTMRKLFIVMLALLLAMSLGACKGRQAEEEKEAQEDSTGDNIAADVWEKPSDSVSDTKDEKSASSDNSEQKEKDSTPTDAPATNRPSAGSPAADSPTTGDTPTDSPAAGGSTADSPSQQPSSGDNKEEEEILDTNPVYEGDEGWLPWK